ncbi:class I SAM-dependent methyltransferase [Neorhodopirellula pilleata]|uniref:Tellurite methyltransferase n=1 Tax=Neorhodopirellula pilleata TaxID=2714738 RepID=A0A5C6AQR0_9BACT|nr:class I SAM-dependent methyltransferase [Neorhodopirellula pilleata]TWU01827.1 Tellurite methyltransferase [Neorhodopirellula pilleata]
MTSPSSDYFFDVYNRDDIAYGMEPSAALEEFLKQAARPSGKAVDLGAGAGRDSIALALAGYDVTSVDLSDRGLARIAERAVQYRVSDRVKTQLCDVREFEFPRESLDAVIATTVLDHIPAADAETVWQRMCDSLTDCGMLYVQVHTTADPGCDQLPGRDRDVPVSETADAVINYFSPNQLAAWAVAAKSRLRILRYEERLEWDYTHGSEHQHGKAVLLAVRQGYHPDWFGQPAVFPRRNSAES